MAVGWPEECLPGSASGERQGWENITILLSQFLKLGQWGPMEHSRGMHVRDRSGLLPKSLTCKTEAVIRKGLQASRFAEADGKCPEILDPPPYPPSNNAGNLATIFSRLRRTVSLRTPPHPHGAAKAEALLSRSPSNTLFPHFLPSVWYGVQQFNQQHAGSMAATAFCLHSNPGKRLAEAVLFLCSCSSGEPPGRRKPAHRIACSTLLS